MNGDWTLGLRHLWVCVAAAGMMLFSSCGDKPVPAPEEQVDSRPLPTGPDVILVLVGTARADQMTPWGAPKNVTPTLHAMAQRGVRFEQTIAQAPWTRPGSSGPARTRLNLSG